MVLLVRQNLTDVRHNVTRYDATCYVATRMRSELTHRHAEEGLELAQCDVDLHARQLDLVSKTPAEQNTTMQHTHT